MFVQKEGVIMLTTPMDILAQFPVRKRKLQKQLILKIDAGNVVAS